MHVIHLGQRRRFWMNATTLTVLCAICATAITAWVGSAVVTSSSQQATIVKVANVIQRNVVAWDEFSGHLEAVDRVEIRALVAGTIQAVHFREGALVRAGDVLFTIDDSDYRAELQHAGARAAEARLRVQSSTAQLELQKRAPNNKAIDSASFKELDSAKARAEAELRLSLANVRTARLNLANTQVLAPAAGRVGRIEVAPGELAGSNQGATALTTLAPVSPIYATFEVSQDVARNALRGLPRDALGQASVERVIVQVQASAQAHIVTGHLQLVDTQVIPGTRNVRLRAIFENPEGALVPGELAHVRMSQAPAPPALLVSDRAVQTDDSKNYVLVVGADNRLSYRQVTLGAVVNGLRVVTSGLKAEERVVVEGLRRVREGAVVDPQLATMEGDGSTGKL